MMHPERLFDLHIRPATQPWGRWRFARDAAAFLLELGLYAGGSVALVLVVTKGGEWVWRVLHL